MSLVEKLCKELGVKVGEVWLGNDGKNYYINYHGQLCSVEYKDNLEEDEIYRPDDISRVLTGKLKPVWKPKKGEEYYYPQPNCNMHYGVSNMYYGVSKWKNTHKDKERLKLGLVFKTKKEATESAKKMLKIRKAIEPDKMVIDLNGDIYHDTGFEIKKVSPQGKVYWTYQRREDNGGIC